MMEALVAIGLVSNIVQIIDFSSKLLSNYRELYRSSVGAFAANVDIEAAATRLVLLNNRIEDSTTTTSDDALKRLCESCSSTADELLAALDTVKAEGRKDKWESIGKALRSVWAKEQIAALEERLAISKLTLAHLKRYNHLDMATRGILDAILKHQDVFEAVYETQAATIRASHNEVVSRLETEHTTARLEVIRETALIIEDEHVRTRNVLQEIQTDGAFTAYPAAYTGTFDHTVGSGVTTLPANIRCFTGDEIHTLCRYTANARQSGARMYKSQNDSAMAEEATCDWLILSEQSSIGHGRRSGCVLRGRTSRHPSQFCVGNHTVSERPYTYSPKSYYRLHTTQAMQVENLPNELRLATLHDDTKCTAKLSNTTVEISASLSYFPSSLSTTIS
ncbi:uncharacterized protein BDR25DRAFT_362751 [Lindgomyces ingoldianus]|uniref:Uncharacterized protein n=1 Tax=Lindgomyces ingoldianus TaxID=673940 RepID=A0ACB6QAP7_9PLEO|nr:uncharacterized protein BDR25DRAFT_362751 [Lindgomyces ingoldianus]KAF2463570.1 hypothetical protein BDR25DRAFT_362751 [Lindgomyces ingoldianus]